MQRILLFGKNGQLGWELRRTLAPLGELIVLDFPEVDFSRPEDLHDKVEALKPDLIVNAVAYTAVDKAESEPEICRKVNGIAPGIIAEIACKTRAPLIHFSTDYVYSGSKGTPYVEGDRPEPLNVYGQSKLEGDQAIEHVGGAYLTFRTSWVYSNRRGGFVTKVLQWASQQETMKMVTDQVGNPTWARMLAEVTAQVVAQGKSHLYDWLKERSGMYHLAGSGYASRYEWAEEILRLDPDPETRKVKQLLGSKTEEFPLPATRPLFSALDCSRFTEVFGLRMPDWKTALALAMEQD